MAYRKLDTRPRSILPIRQFTPETAFDQCCQRYTAAMGFALGVFQKPFFEPYRGPFDAHRIQPVIPFAAQAASDSAVPKALMRFPGSPVSPAVAQSTAPLHRLGILCNECRVSVFGGHCVPRCWTSLADSVCQRLRNTLCSSYCAAYPPSTEGVRGLLCPTICLDIF